MQNGELLVKAKEAWGGVRRTITNTAKAGDRYKIRVLADRGTTDVVRLFLAEGGDPTTPEWSTYGTQYLQPGVQLIEFLYTVTETGSLSIQLDKTDASALQGTETNFKLLEAKIEKIGLDVLEENNYYAFGMKHQGYNNVVTATDPALKYKYQGQEQDDELGLNWYSFKYRNYDYTIGRFFNIDPLAEDFVYQSPYNFAENKVIEAIELEGLESFYTQDGSLATGQNQSGPLSNEYRTANNLYTRSELTQLRANQQSYEGPRVVQDNRTAEERIANKAKWENYYRDLEFRRQVVSNLDNIGSPHTQYQVMVGAAYGAADIVTGEALGKLFQGVKWLMRSSKAENTIVVIGEGMGRVHDAKDALLKHGVKNVEVFQPSKAAMDEWDTLIKGGAHLSDDVVKGTLLFKENTKWIQRAKEAGKTILDIGHDGRKNTSTFYEMEKQTVYGTQ